MRRSGAIVLLILASFVPTTARATQEDTNQPKAEAGPEGQAKFPGDQEFEPADAVEELWLVEVADSPIVSTLLTLLAAFVGFLGSQWVDRRKAERAEHRRFAAAITSARNEIDFYIVKLNYLSKQMSDLINSIESSSGGPVVLPSYTLYPAFLEQAKIRLATFMLIFNSCRPIST